MHIEKAIELAIQSIDRHGDTDVFLFPFETYVFFDNLFEALAIADIYQYCIDFDFLITLT